VAVSGGRAVVWAVFATFFMMFLGAVMVI
jgi:hypothetical protein